MSTAEPLKTGSHRPVATLQRGLAVLVEIGQRGADVAVLVERTGFSRTTIYRILATLEVDGYLTRKPVRSPLPPLNKGAPAERWFY